jgi:AraC-like DNA-binding protein
MPGLDNILILIAVVHAYLFTVMLLSDRRYSTRILGIYMLIVFLEYVLNANMYMFKISSLNFLFYFLAPMISISSIPFIYLYVKYMSSEHFVINRKSLLHFIPSILFLAYTMVVLLSFPPDILKSIIQGTDKESEEYLSVRMIFFITNLYLYFQVFYYSARMLILLLRHSNLLQKTYSFKEKISLKWLIVFVVIFLSYYIFEFIIFIYGDIPVSESVYFLVIVFHVFFIGIMGLRQREIYEKNSLPDNVVKEEVTEVKNQVDNRVEVKKPLHADEDEKIKMAYNVKKIMEEKKLYLNSELSLYDLATELNIHKNYLSHIINDVFGHNFFNFVNTYRIEEAKKMLKDEKYNNLSVDGIARSVGFKSRNVFYPVFRKFVGKTPSEYKKGE